MIVSSLVIALATLVVVFFVVRGDFVAPRARDIAWLAGSGTVPDDEADVIRRYLARHRRHRTIGGLVGVIATAVAGLRYQGSASFVALLFGGIAGVLVGTLAAESYRLGARAGGTAVASLEPRDPAPLPRVVWAARALLVASVLGAVAVAAWSHDTSALLVVAGGALVTAVAEATRGRIVGRRRPVLSFRAGELDARIRAFAGRCVANLQLAAALLVLTSVVVAIPATALLPGALRWLLWVGGYVAAWVYTHRAAPRPPYRWRRPT